MIEDIIRFLKNDIRLYDNMLAICSQASDERTLRLEALITKHRDACASALAEAEKIKAECPTRGEAMTRGLQ